jgi:hypothetical protein
VPVDEPLGGIGEIVDGVEGSLEHLADDVLRHVPGPALGGVKRDHEQSVGVLAAQEIADDRLAIGLGRRRLDKSETSPFERRRLR